MKLLEKLESVTSLSIGYSLIMTITSNICSKPNRNTNVGGVPSLIFKQAY